MQLMTTTSKPLSSTPQMKMVRNLTTEEEKMIRRRKKKGEKCYLTDHPLDWIDQLLKESYMFNYFFNDYVEFI